MLSPIPSVLDSSSTFLLVSWALGSALFLPGPPPQGARGGSLESKPDFPVHLNTQHRISTACHFRVQPPPPSPHFPSKRSLLPIHPTDCLPPFTRCSLSLRLTHCLPIKCLLLLLGRWLIRLDHLPRKYWTWLKLQYAGEEPGMTACACNPSAIRGQRREDDS